MLILGDCGISRAAARFWYDAKSDDARGEFVAGVLGLRVVTSLATCVVLAGVGYFTWPALTNDAIPWTPFLLVLCLGLFFETLNVLTTVFLRVREQAVPYFVLRCLQAGVQVSVTTVLLVSAGIGLAAVVYGQLAASVVVSLIAAARYLARGGVLAFAASHERRSLLAYGWPLIVQEIAWWGRSMADPLILVQFVSAAALGVYNLGYIAGMLMSLAINSVDMSYGPRFYRAMLAGEDRRPDLVRFAVDFVGAFGVLAVVAALFVDELLLRVAGPSYAGAAVIARIVLPAYFLHALYVCFIKPVLFRKRSRTVLLVTLPPTVIAIVTNVLLVPRWGIEVAAWTTLASFAFVAAGAFVAAQRIDAFPYRVSRIIAYTICVVSMCLFGAPVVAILANGLESWVPAAVKGCIAIVFVGVAPRFLLGAYGSPRLARI